MGVTEWKIKYEYYSIFNMKKFPLYTGWWIVHNCGGMCSSFIELCSNCKKRVPKHLVLQLKLLRSK